jgi:hypothetical protein
VKLSRVASGRNAVYVPDHPKANNRGYIPLARYVMEQKLGRLLTFDELVHHKDHDKTNDSPDNLEIETRSEHTRRHIADGSINVGRKLDYDLIETLMGQGYGYKRIAKRLGCPVYSAKSACRLIKKRKH